jgi:hypothetical protein
VIYHLTMQFELSRVRQAGAGCTYTRGQTDRRRELYRTYLHALLLTPRALRRDERPERVRPEGPHCDATEDVPSTSMALPLLLATSATICSAYQRPPPLAHSDA